MSRPVAVKIRGIYATALTQMFMELEGYRVTDPSEEIEARFDPVRFAHGPEDVFIQDGNPKHRIHVSGSDEEVRKVAECLEDLLPDAVLIDPSHTPDDYGCSNVVIEIAGAGKTMLDAKRAEVTATLRHHHRLKLIDPDWVDRAESELGDAPGRQCDLEGVVLERLVIQPLQRQKYIKIEHVKPGGEVLHLRRGTPLSVEGHTLWMRRPFHGGVYDGLDMPIERGDFAVTSVEDQAWYCVHRYFDKDENLKGEYVNINTPVELYADRIRYVDLFVDVVRRAGGKPRIVDEKELDEATRQGLLPMKLRNRALEIARKAVDRMRS